MAFQIGQKINLTATITSVLADGSLTLKLDTGHIIQTTQFDLKDPRPTKRPRLAQLPAQSAPVEIFEPDRKQVTRTRNRACSLIPIVGAMGASPSVQDTFFEVLPKVCTFLSIHEVANTLSHVCKRATRVTKSKAFLKCLDIWVTDEHAYVNYNSDYSFETRLTQKFSPGTSFSVVNDQRGAKTIVSFLKRFNWGNLRQLSLRVENPSCAITRDGIRELIQILQRANMLRGLGGNQLRKVRNPSSGELLEDVTIDQGKIQYPFQLLENLTQVIVAKAKRLRDLTVHGVSLVNDKLLTTVKQNQSLVCLQLNSKALNIPPEHMFKQVRFHQLHLDSFDLEKSPTLAGCLLDCTEHLTLYNCRSLPSFSAGRRRNPRLKSITLNCKKGTSDAKIAKFLRSLPPSIQTLKIRPPTDHPCERLEASSPTPTSIIQCNKYLSSLWANIPMTMRTTMTHVEWKGSNGVVMYPSRTVFPRLSGACINERAARNKRVRKEDMDAY